MELADLFDTSVDVLLGYEMKDNRRQTAAERLQRCRVEKDRTGLTEAEKALQKYPNDFAIVDRSAALYRVFGIVEADEALLRRALALLGVNWFGHPAEQMTMTAVTGTNGKTSTTYLLKAVLEQLHNRAEKEEEPVTNDDDAITEEDDADAEDE